MKKNQSIITRLFFWLLSGLLSTFFAEVLSGSSPYFLFARKLINYPYIRGFP